MVDFNNLSASNIFFPKNVTPEWKCKIKIFNKGTFSETNPYTIEMTNQKVKSVKGILPVSTDYTKYSLFGIIAGLDGNSENITMSDLKGTLEMFAKNCLGENT